MKPLTRLEKLEKIIKQSSANSDEKEELWTVVQEIVHHRIIGCILDNLDKSHHEAFMSKYLDKKNIDEEIISFLEEKEGKEITHKLHNTIQEIEEEILKELN